eukprot:TRINITY_DN3212_c0_g1_i4.p1 TRINITY_DN3212_c0_g1~~TRINITY_DN3212_c0_g1_i4.p1  ORF type:complete len:812 (-),score=234.37 TRINITY_DN3212_c0_g1_i4:48-2324(-)
MEGAPEASEREQVAYNQYTKYFDLSERTLEQVNTTQTLYASCTPLQQRQSWVSDESRPQCSYRDPSTSLQCAVAFSSYYHRHHCRACGEIFCCYHCRPLKIPKCMPVPNPSQPTSWMGTLGSLTKSVWTLWDPSLGESEFVCDYCVPTVKLFVDAAEARTLSIVQLRARSDGLAKCLVRFWRGIQYHLPAHEYKDVEKDLLWASRDLIQGHGIWMTHLLLSIDPTKSDMWEEAVRLLLHPPAQHIRCSQLLCSLQCSASSASAEASKCMLSPCDALTLLSRRVCDKRVRSYAVWCLLSQDSSVLVVMLPVLVQYLQYEQIEQEYSLFDLLAKRAEDNHELLVALYYALIACKNSEMPADGTYHKLHERLLDAKYCLFSAVQKLELASPWLQYMEYAGQPDRMPPYNTQVLAWCIPTHSEKTCTSIDWEKVEVKDSAAAPRLFQCHMADGSTESVLWKKDDLRQDQIIINIIKLMTHLLTEDLKNIVGGIPLVTYRVVPLSPSAGLIQVIREANTLGNIHRDDGELQNFLTRHQRDAVTSTWQETFAKSLAAYTIITYLLGIGDRHEDNLMIDYAARLFHIDYGFVLGQCPTFSGHVGVPPIRLTSDMLNVIGGRQAYPHFVVLCQAIFFCLQRRVRLIAVMLEAVIVDQMHKMTASELDTFLVSRFMVGQPRRDCAEAVSRLLRESEHSVCRTLNDLKHRSRHLLAPRTLINLNAVYGLFPGNTTQQQQQQQPPPQPVAVAPPNGWGAWAALGFCNKE